MIGLDPYVYVSANGVDWKLCMDVVEAFRWRHISLHTSRPIPTTLSIRLYGKSTVLRTNLDTGFSTICLLRHCWNTLNDGRGRYTIQFLTRDRHTPVHSELEMRLLHIAKHDYGQSNAMYDSLLASELWQLWNVSARVCTPRVHMVNMSKVKRALRKKGITLTPDSIVRISIPSTVLVTKRELRRELMLQLDQSFVPRIIRTFITKNMLFVKSKAPTVGDMLRNQAKMIGMLQYGDLPCTCHLYPGLPKRHGHVYVPSWQYEGVGEEVVNSNMKSRVFRTKSGWQAKMEIKKWWGRSLPSSIYPDVYCFQPDSMTGDPDNMFQATTVRAAARHLKDLAVVGVDKCMGRSLLH